MSELPAPPNPPYAKKQQERRAYLSPKPFETVQTPPKPAVSTQSSSTQSKPLPIVSGLEAPKPIEQNQRPSLPPSKKIDAPPWVTLSSEEKKQEFRKEFLGQISEKPKLVQSAKPVEDKKDVDKTIADRLFGKPLISLGRKKEEPVPFDAPLTQVTPLPKLASKQEPVVKPTPQPVPVPIKQQKPVEQKPVAPKPIIMQQRNVVPSQAEESKEEKERSNRLKAIKELTLQTPLQSTPEHPVKQASELASKNNEDEYSLDLRRQNALSLQLQGQIMAAEQELLKLEDKLERVREEINSRSEELDERRYEQKQIIEQAEEERLLEEELEVKSRNLREQSTKTQELLEQLEKKLALVEKEVNEKQSKLISEKQTPPQTLAPVAAATKTELVVPTPPAPKPAVEYIEELKPPTKQKPVELLPPVKQSTQLEVPAPKVEEVMPESLVSEEEESEQIIEDLGLAKEEEKAGESAIPVPKKQKEVQQPASGRRMYLRAQSPKKVDENEEVFTDVYSQVKEQQKAEKQQNQKQATSQTTSKTPTKQQEQPKQDVGVNDLFGAPKTNEEKKEPPQEKQGGEKELFGQLSQVAAGTSGGSSLFNQLDSISASAKPSAAIQTKCPTCQSATPKVVYCPYCTAGMCVNCSPSIRSEGDSFVYTCPKCGEEVTAKKSI